MMRFVWNGYEEQSFLLKATPGNMHLIPEPQENAGKSLHERLRKKKSGLKLGSPRIKGLPMVYGLYILSTSRGIITDKDARQLNVGGEVLCNVW
jgi:Ribosomal protein S8